MHFNTLTYFIYILIIPFISFVAYLRQWQRKFVNICFQSVWWWHSTVRSLRHTLAWTSVQYTLGLHPLSQTYFQHTLHFFSLYVQPLIIVAPLGWVLSIYFFLLLSRMREWRNSCISGFFLFVCLFFVCQESNFIFENILNGFLHKL
jgi:hypothetical protein